MLKGKKLARLLPDWHAASCNTGKKKLKGTFHIEMHHDSCNMGIVALDMVA